MSIIARQAMPVRILTLLLAALVATLLVPAPAAAQTCSASVTDVDFGDPGLLSGTVTDAVATLTVTCTGIPLLTVVKMCPSIGEGSGGASGSARLLRTTSGQLLGYQLYRDSSRTQGWGAVDNTELGTVPVLTLGTGFSGSATTTARIFARLFAPPSTAQPGTYISRFVGAQTAFSYSLYLVGSNVGCTGFVGSAVIRPEFDVTATAAASCAVSAADLIFPAAGALTSALTATGNLDVICTARTAYAIALDNGTTGTAPTARRMVSAAGAAVTYGLYRNSARTLAWGATSGLTLSGTGTGTSQSIPVYGQVPAQTTPRPATYADRVVVTLTY